MKCKITYLILVGFVMISCNKQLNTIPTDFITPANYYSTETQLNSALTGVYDVLGSGNLYSDNLLHVLTSGNDEYVQVYPQQIYRAVSTYNYDPSERFIIGLWNDLYRGINNANIVLEAIDNENAKSIPQDKKNVIRAQVLFLRGYYYFLLVERWGGVPMPLSATRSSKDVGMARSSTAEVYAQILKDMEAAEAVLPQASTLGPNSSGRLSKNTAQGILGRVCLSMAGWPLNDVSKYEDALKWTEKVISTGENSLDPSYADLFVKESRDEYYVPELMWEVEFYGNVVSTAYREQGFVGIRNGMNSDGIPFPGFGYNFMKPTGKLFLSYHNNTTTSLSNDLRRDRNIAPYDWVGGNVEVASVKGFWSPNQIYERWSAKWRRDEEVMLPRFKNGNGTNFPILRYSDVLLMFAEAENFLKGPTATAYNAINQVRRRAYGTGNKVIDITLTNGGSKYTAIPTVTISAGTDPNGANAATATATISAGVVTSIRLVTQGAFYTAAPSVTITSSNTVGTGATATAKIAAINISEADLASGLSKSQFLAQLQQERSRELAFECLRTQDLRRWNILIQEVRATATDFRANAPLNGGSSNRSIAAIGPRQNLLQQYGAEAGEYIDIKHLYWPIPSTEIALNKLIVQNPGW